MTPARTHPPGFQDGVAERLAATGRSPAAIAALLDLDHGLFLWHRAVAKGDGIAELLTQIGARLELAEFGALTAIARISQGIDRPQPEAPTVGALAQELGIDPSRASRLAAQLIGQGLVRRAADQDDARRICLVLTPDGLAILAGIRAAKWDRYIATFAGWNDDDVASLARLMRRFMESSRAARERLSGRDAGGESGGEVGGETEADSTGRD